MITEDLQRQIIMDHYKHPQNRIENEEQVQNYLTFEALNPSCGDQVKIFLTISENKITDIKFLGEGCSICCASSSVMTSELKSQTLETVTEKITQFQTLLKTGQITDEELFEDAICFSGIKDYPARFKCAFIAWDAVSSLLKEANNE